MASGQSPEMARAVAARLGIGRVEWRLTDFDSLLDELEEGRIDVVAAGMFVTPEREKRATFSRAVFLAPPGALVAPGNPKNIHAQSALLARAELRVAAIGGSVEARLLRHAGLDNSGRLVEVPDAATGRQLVAAGRADALLLSRPTVRWMAEEAARDGRADVESAEPFEAPAELTGRVAFAFRRRDEELRAAWDEALEVYLRGDDYRELAGRFGFDPLPSTGRVGEVSR